MTPEGTDGIFPSREEFGELARHHGIIPIAREMVADTLTPVGVFMAVVGEGDGFLLESVEGGERWGRYSFVGRNPLATIRSHSLAVEVGSGTAAPGASHLADGLLLESGPGILATIESAIEATSTPDLLGLPPLHSGIVGYLGYDVVREVERLEDPPPDELGLPDSSVVVIGELVAFDHWRQRITLLSNVALKGDETKQDLDALYDAALTSLDGLETDVFRPIQADPRPAPLPEARLIRAEATARTPAGQFQLAVDAAKESIAAGDIFQVVLSQRFDIEGEVDGLAVYRSLRLLNPSPYLYLLRLAGVQVVGSSPEPMVRVRDGQVTSRPIAGSRPRGATTADDSRLAAELSEDPKEVAEHVMLVDLARNDLGRVSRYGSEVVEEFMTIERYSHIMHMTSQVVGTLREGCSAIDVLRATLPAGTLSGAPKVRAMEIIDELEPARRGVYGGVVGYLDFSGNLDTAIAIRTMVVTPEGSASVQAGAGIVADSDPDAEDAECRSKAAAVLAAVADSRRASR